MDTQSPKPQPSERTPSVQDVLRVWRSDRCVSASTAQQYLQWIGRFRRYCRALGLEEGAELSRDGVKRFQRWYMRSRKINPAHLGVASSSLRSLRRVHEVMGLPVPPWRSIECLRPPAMVVLRDYAAHLKQVRGNPEITIRKKLDHVGKLFKYLRRSGKSWRAHTRTRTVLHRDAARRSYQIAPDRRRSMHGRSDSSTKQGALAHLGNPR